jgi:sporulation protein YlmC with PRC-barrel domain
MELAIGTAIYGRDGDQVGELSRIVVDGKTGDVTHLVVGKGWLLPRDIVISVDDVEAAAPDHIRIRLDKDQLEQKPDFYELHYVAPGGDDPIPAPYASESLLYTPVTPSMGTGWFMPYPYPVPPADVEMDVNVPPGSVTLSDGMDVWVGDDKAGTVTGVRIHPRTDNVSHIVVSQGWLFPEERVIPISAVRSVDERGVHLALSVDDLRAIPPAVTT